MTKLITQDIVSSCKTLRLTHLPEVVEAYCSVALKNNTPPLNMVSDLLELEVTHKKEGILNRKLKQGRFPKFKSIEDFDFSFQPSLDKKTILGLTDLNFINQKENIIFL